MLLVHVVVTIHINCFMELMNLMKKLWLGIGAKCLCIAIVVPYISKEHNERMIQFGNISFKLIFHSDCSKGTSWCQDSTHICNQNLIQVCSLLCPCPPPAPEVFERDWVNMKSSCTPHNVPWITFQIWPFDIMHLLSEYKYPHNL